MWNDERGIIGIGYEGLSVVQLTDQIAAWGITTLVDVRLNPQSRKPGFSRKSLSAYLETKAIAYIHMPELGNARDNRGGYSQPGSDEGDAARAVFVEQLRSPAAVAKLNELAALASASHIAVLCFEQRETECHRHEVLDAVRGRLADLIDA